MKSALSNTKWSSAGWALALAATLVLLVGAVLPPFVGPGVEAALMSGFQHLCHQLPSRSFSVGGVALAVCHRCMGIYVGLVAGTLLLPLVRTRAPRWVRYDRWVLLAAVLPTVLDWGGDVLGAWSNTVGTRVATGLWLGGIVGVVFARSLAIRLAPRMSPRNDAEEPVSVA